MSGTDPYAWGSERPLGVPSSRNDVRFPPGTRLLNGRFTVGERLGAGGMGTVYRAFDAMVGAEIALKVLHTRGPAGIYQLKREFRALASVVHPNLIDLFELYCDDSEPLAPVWFFTMQLIEGTDFCRALRAGDGQTSCDFERLRGLLPQLVSGVSALHAAGKLHRDIKPTNVLVDATGKLVILDFGVVKDLWSPDVLEEAEAGTPAYMAPELYVGSAKASRATDWYSVGVLLFEAMTGRLPRWGLRERPSASAPDVPPDLDRLCAELLETDADARPKGEAIAAELGAQLELPVVEAHGVFVGRAPELARLRDIVQSLAPGAPVIAQIQGSSGIGKTALAHRLATLAGETARALVLRSRCYEREAVPFKAIDAIIDQLSEELSQEGPGADPCSPEDAACAVRVFPVLGRVSAFASADREPQDGDAQRIRERGFEVLAREIERLGETRPVVLVIDDVQWGDADSAKFLVTLLAVAVKTRLLLVFTHRPAAGTDGVFLETMRERLAAAQHSVRVETLELGVLSSEEARALAGNLLGRPGDEATERVGRESGGVPMFVFELARQAGGDGQRDSAPPSINVMLERRVARLPERARALLEVLAVASHPLDRRQALEAAAVPLEDVAVIRNLSLGRLVAVTAGVDGARLETYHDRVREGILERLPEPRLRAIHAQLADTLERAGDAEPERLFVHYLGAQRFEQAKRAGREAATRADSALAFDRAAALYKQVIELDREADDRWTLAEKMGNAYVNAGRSADAGDAFDLATTLHTAGRRADAAVLLGLRTRAAEQYLQSAKSERGLAVIKSVLNEQGIAYPSSNARAALAIMANRTRFVLRGFAFKPATGHAPAVEAQLEALWIASKSLSWVSPLPATLFSSTLTLRAFETGHPRYLAFVLSIVAAQEVMMELDYLDRRAERIAELAHELARASGSPFELGYYHMGRAGTRWFRGRFAEAVEAAERSADIFADLGRVASYERAVANLWGLHSLAMTGDLVKLGVRSAEVRRDALERGDVFSERNAVLGQSAIARLAEGEPGLVLERAEAVMAIPPPEFTVHNYHLLVTRAQTAFYRDEPAVAWNHVVDAWPGVASSFLDKLACARDELLQLRAHAALAVAERMNQRAKVRAPGRGELDRAGLLKLAAKDAKTIAGHRLPQCAPFAASIQAGLARAEGDRTRARSLLEQATRGFEHAGMALHREVTRYALARLEAGPGAAPPDWFREQGVAEPLRLAKAIAPSL